MTDLPDLPPGVSRARRAGTCARCGAPYPPGAWVRRFGDGWRFVACACVPVWDRPQTAPTQPLDPLEPGVYEVTEPLVLTAAGAVRSQERIAELERRNVELLRALDQANGRVITAEQRVAELDSAMTEARTVNTQLSDTVADQTARIRGLEAETRKLREQAERALRRRPPSSPPPTPPVLPPAVRAVAETMSAPVDDTLLCTYCRHPRRMHDDVEGCRRTGCDCPQARP